MKHPLLLLLICCGLCTAVSARPIRGTVKCGGRPLGGVAVTDGYTFAQSDAQGAFALDADDEALFISVVTPAGYIAPLKEGVPQFFLPYTPSAKRFDFELQAWPEPRHVTNCWPSPTRSPRPTSISNGSAPR